MSEVQSPIQEPSPFQPAVQPQSQPQPRNGFSGKQVAGFILSVLVLLAIGLAIGGVIGYRLGMAEGAQSFGFQIPFGDNNGLPAVPFGNGGQPAQPNTAPAASGPYLGVEIELLTPEVAAGENMTGTTGALIKTVVAGSPAAKAGLKAGDVIAAVDGKPIEATNNLSIIMLNHKVGDEITLTIVTGTANGPTDQHDVKVTLAARPAQRQFQMPPGQPGAPSLDSREG